MPTTRRRKSRQLVEVDDYMQQVHAEVGCCMLGGGPTEACACGLRDEHGVTDWPALNAIRVRLGLPEVHDADK